jgi:antitoxin (DNA-binding transcriptional repressor) of toxin-antitoxin stability system
LFILHLRGVFVLCSLLDAVPYSGFDRDTVLVSILSMTSITSKELHEQTGALLDRVKQGQRFRVLRGGQADALLVPADEQVDPAWDEIMAEVRKVRAQGFSCQPNPILAERKNRHYAARLRR